MRCKESAQQTSYFDETNLAEPHHNPNVCSEARGTIHGHSNLNHSELLTILHARVSEHVVAGGKHNHRIYRSTSDKGFEEAMEIEAFFLDANLVK